MVLHHIPEKQLKLTLNAIYNSLNDHGILLIKEHDCISTDDKIFADLTHSLFMIQQAREVESESILAQKIYYKSAAEWSELICSYGFRDLSDQICSGESLSKNYVALFEKK